MTQATDLEQLLLEYINEARLDPTGAAARYISSYSPLSSPDPQIQARLGSLSGSSLQSAFANLSAAQPLAWNENLGTVAEKHSAAMIAARTQARELPGEDFVFNRFTLEGYSNFSQSAENSYGYAKSVLFGHAAFMTEWGAAGNEPGPLGTRAQIMNPKYSEIGLDVTAESTTSNPLGPYVITEDLGDRGKIFMLGVAYTDKDNNEFYSLGEGRNDLVITRVGAAAISMNSGGYSIEMVSGSQSFNLFGGGLSGVVTITGVMRENVKVDVVNGDTLLTSGSISVAGDIAELRGLGIVGLTLTASTGDQVLSGTKANDTLNGGAGTDIAEFAGRSAAYTFRGTAADLTVTGGPEGTDRLLNIEVLRFADGDFVFNANGTISKYVLPDTGSGGSNGGGTGGTGGGTTDGGGTGGGTTVPVQTPSDEIARLYLPTGSQDYGPIPGGAITHAFGSNSAERLTVAANARIVLDPSFVRGNDTLIIQGNLAKYSITSDVAGITLSGNGATIRIPSFGNDGGLQINFADGIRDLITLDGGNTFVLGPDNGQPGAGSGGSTGGGTGGTPSTTVSLDVGTPTVARTISASGGDFTFSDNAELSSNVIVTGIGSGDKIVVTSATAEDYNFQRSFEDINDLVITYIDPQTGAANTIVLDDALPDTGRVNNFLTAQLAMGFDFMTFA